MIQDNYELFGTESTVSRLKEIYMHTYISSSGFNFWQQDSSSFSISVDNETTTHEITEINGYEAHLFYELYPDVSDELESMCYNVLLIWQEGNTTLHISALDMSRADIFRIAEGIRPIRK